MLSVIRKPVLKCRRSAITPTSPVYGACRMCVVEDEKTGKIDASCSMEPRDACASARTAHGFSSTGASFWSCCLPRTTATAPPAKRAATAAYRSLAQQFGVRRIRFPDTREHYEIDSSSPAVLRDPNKCILCGDCVRVCEEMQGMGILNFAYRGSNLQVMPAFDRKLAETKCVSCGQCAAVCTTGAITVKNQIGEAWRAITTPASALSSRSRPPCAWPWARRRLPAGENVLDRLVTALKLMGVDEVYDTTFGADFTTIAESEEFLERLKNGGPFPMFTSCCPAWVKYLENENPKYLKNISTCKSPMEMVARSSATSMPRRTLPTAARPITSPSCPARRRRWRPRAPSSSTTVDPMSTLCSPRAR